MLRDFPCIVARRGYTTGITLLTERRTCTPGNELTGPPDREGGHRETIPWDVDFALVVSSDPDCDGNSASDADDILTGLSADCDSNGVPDECDPDRNGNGIPDDCELTVPKGACCLFNPDRCERRAQCSCTALGGTYIGDGTSCTPMQCLQYGPQPGPGVGQVP